MANLKCPQCGKEYGQADDLVPHIMLSHFIIGKKNDGYTKMPQCWCGRFIFWQDLERHLEDAGGALAHFAECALGVVIPKGG